MNTIDTVEKVQRAAQDWDTFRAPGTAAMLNRYAALIEAVNRPVTDDDAERGCCRYYNSGNPVYPPVHEAMKAALESHMAALREEAGK